MEDPDKILPPSGDFVLVALHAGEPGNYVPFTLFDHLPLDLGQGSAIEAPVSGSLGLRFIGMAHVVNSPIASMTD